MKLWRYNKITGYWILMRDCASNNAAQWLEVFQADEPKEYFKLSNKKPRGLK